MAHGKAQRAEKGHDVVYTQVNLEGGSLSCVNGDLLSPS